jgi:hypothetical protein
MKQESWWLPRQERYLWSRLARVLGKASGGFIESVLEAYGGEHHHFFALSLSRGASAAAPRLKPSKVTPSNGNHRSPLACVVRSFPKRLSNMEP